MIIKIQLLGVGTCLFCDNDLSSMQSTGENSEHTIEEEKSHRGKGTGFSNDQTLGGRGILGGPCAERHSGRDAAWKGR